MPAAGQALERRLNIDRREFLTFCTAIAATMGLPKGASAEVAEAITKKDRPSVIWLHHQECTGCTESLLRAEHPTLEKLILDIISLDYHETLFAAAGHQIEAAKRDAMEKNKGKYLLVVEGAIPMKDGGIYCKIGGQHLAGTDARGSSKCGGGHRDRVLRHLGRDAFLTAKPHGLRRRCRSAWPQRYSQHSGLPVEPVQLPRLRGAFPNVPQASANR